MSSRFDPQLLGTFVAVAHARNITRAGKQVGLTQSAISLQIRRLEEQLGARLFHRSQQGVTLTTAGEALLPYARRVLQLGQEAFDAVQGAQPAGGLRFGTNDVYAIRYLPEVIERFREQYPDVVPSIHCDVSTLVVERFERGELDLCLVVRHDPSSGGETVGREEPVWTASPSLQLNPDTPVPLAVYPEYCIYRAHALRALAEHGRPWRVVYTSQSAAAIEVAIDRGFAVGVVARRFVPGRWRVLGEPEGLPPLAPVSVELLRASSESPAVNGFAKLIRDRVAADQHV